VSGLTNIPISPLPPERFRAVLGEHYASVEEAITEARELLGGRVVWHLNSTAVGGGVAELLHSLLAYARGAGADMRWMVIGGDPEFFRITKSIHNRLHGADGVGPPMSEAEHEKYLEVCHENADLLAELVQPGDVVYLHDPQTAGMCGRIADLPDVTVIWRCHIGVDDADEGVRHTWDFLRPLIEPADCWVFSRPGYEWEGLDPDRVAYIAPSIDAFSPKNEDLPPGAVTAILDKIGLSPDGDGPAVFNRQDGTMGRVDRRANIVQDEPLPAGDPVLTQVSRWDRLKDPVGVVEGFARSESSGFAHLLLVGPDALGVSDDPEGAEVYREVERVRAALAPDVRRRVHLVSLPMADVDENAAMVNAIQRRSTAIAQKSLAEGFGLTATEAMWKSKPVIGGAVGGLQDQIVDGVTGRLIDPRDLGAFAAAIDELLGDPELAARMGDAGRERVTEQFLGTRHLIEYVHLLSGMLKPRG
jgi:trehalose synthase